jgi:hypothetical protein
MPTNLAPSQIVPVEAASAVPAAATVPVAPPVAPGAAQFQPTVVAAPATPAAGMDWKMLAVGAGVVALGIYVLRGR